MRSISRLGTAVWVLVLIASLAFAVRVVSLQVRRAVYVSSLPERAVPTPEIDDTSSTGYVDGLRRYVVPGHNLDSYHWIAQTQIGLAEGKWRMRWVDYDNAPQGRELHWAAPYRWWLSAIAIADHHLNRVSLGIAVERAALIADPLLLLCGVIFITVVAARQLGVLAACVAAVSSTILLPLSPNFQAGAPDHHGLIALLAMTNVLAVVLAMEAKTTKNSRSWMLVSGVTVGCGLWVSAASFVPLIAGVGLGALVAALTQRQTRDLTADIEWRVWGVAGAVTSFVAYGIEYFPDHMGWRLEVNHPLYALALLGAGEVLHTITRWIVRRPEAQSRTSSVRIVGALLAMSAVPATIAITGSRTFLLLDPFLKEVLTGNIDEVLSTTASIARNGLGLGTIAGLSPIVLIIPAILLVLLIKIAPRDRWLGAFSIGPVAATLLLALAQVRWWNLFDAALVPYLAVTSLVLSRTQIARIWRISWLVVVGAALLPSVLVLAKDMKLDPHGALTESEVEGLANRDVSQWLRRVAGSSQSVVYASPNLGSFLMFHGGLRTLGTLYWENRDGLEAGSKLVGAKSMDVVAALVRERGIRYIVVPSWDSYLYRYARAARGMGPGDEPPPDSFINELMHWRLPLWLRPIPYREAPVIGGAPAAVYVLEVVPDQRPADASARLVEYFLTMGRIDFATSLEPRLKSYPTDLSVLIALARLDAARRDRVSLKSHLTKVFARLQQDTSLKTLAADRRASLARLLNELGIGIPPELTDFSNLPTPHQ